MHIRFVYLIVLCVHSARTVIPHLLYSVKLSVDFRIIAFEFGSEICSDDPSRLLMLRVEALHTHPYIDPLLQLDWLCR